MPCQEVFLRIKLERGADKIDAHLGGHFKGYDVKLRKLLSVNSETLKRSER